MVLQPRRKPDDLIGLALHPHPNLDLLYIGAAHPPGLVALVLVLVPLLLYMPLGEGTRPRGFHAPVAGSPIASEPKPTLLFS